MNGLKSLDHVLSESDCDTTLDECVVDCWHRCERGIECQFSVCISRFGTTETVSFEEESKGERDAAARY